MIENKKIKGTGYKLSDMQTVSYVDANYPHAIVDENGNWVADAAPSFTPILPQKSSGKMAIAFCSDSSYFPGLIPAISSVRQYHPEIPLVVIDRGLTKIQVAYLRQFADVFPSSNQLPELPLWGKLDVSLLDYERVIYLDSDVILLDRISDLLKTKAEFAAVKNLDWGVKENFTNSQILQKYGINPETPAFNAGVFSIDNQVWGNGKLLDEAMKVYQEIGEYFIYDDQSVLQILMNSTGHQIEFLDDEYNAIAECWGWNDSIKKVRILHYAGDEIKPWNPLCKQPKLEYFFDHSKIKQ